MIKCPSTSPISFKCPTLWAKIYISGRCNALPLPLWGGGGEWSLTLIGTLQRAQMSRTRDLVIFVTTDDMIALRLAHACGVIYPVRARK